MSPQNTASLSSRLTLTLTLTLALTFFKILLLLYFVAVEEDIMEVVVALESRER